MPNLVETLGFIGKYDLMFFYLDLTKVDSLMNTESLGIFMALAQRQKSIKSS